MTTKEVYKEYSLYKIEPGIAKELGRFKTLQEATVFRRNITKVSPTLDLRIHVTKC